MNDSKLLRNHGLLECLYMRWTGAIIRNYDLEVTVGLMYQALQDGQQRIAAIEGRNNYGNQGWGGHFELDYAVTKCPYGLQRR